MPFPSLPSWVPARTGDIRSRRAGSDSEAEPDRRPSSAEPDRRFIGCSFLRRRNFFLVLLPLLIVTVSWPFLHFTFPSVESRHDESKVESFDEYNKNLGINFTDEADDSLDDLVLDPFDYKETEIHNITSTNERDKLQKPSLPEANKEMAYQQTNNATLFSQKDDKHRRPSGKNSHKINHRDRHRTDARVRQFKDQLAIAKVYLEVEPTKSHAQFIRELQQQVMDVQRIVSNANMDSELPNDASKKQKAMEETLSKGKKLIDDCVATERSLRAIIRSTEGQLRTERRQIFFLTQLLAKTIPKGLHCLPLKLATDYHALNSSQQNQFPNQEKLEDPNLHHYALFTDNVLAASVVVNSTLHNAKHPGDHVFHVVTDELNYAAMKMWFLSNPLGRAAIQVQKVEEFTWLNSSYSPVLKQLESDAMIDYYFNTRDAKPDGMLKYRNPKYLSILNHLRFYIPEIFPKLNKVVFLDDDIVVQKDLSGLWSIDLKGNVNGAVETCKETFHRFDKYLNFSHPLIAKNFDPHACGWAYGMNVFDLAQWRKQNITDVYHNWQKLNHDRQLWQLGSLPPGLITFYNHTLAINRSWHVLGLGYDENVVQKDIENAAVIHYNGNQKPWLEIAIAKYRNYWSKYVDYGHFYLRCCNVVP